MEAKKKSEIVKPRYLQDTKVYKYMKFLYVGVLAYTFLGGYLTYLYFRSHPNRFSNTNPLARYYQSQEYLIKEAEFLGLLPPKVQTKIDLEKLDAPIPRGSAQDSGF